MKIYFLRMNIFLLVPMLIYRCRGYKIFFLECERSLQRQKLFFFLSKIGIFWLNYQAEKNVSFGSLYRERYDEAVRIGNHIATNNCFNKFENLFYGNTNLKPVIYQDVLSEVAKPIELFNFIRHKNSVYPTKKVCVWMPNTVVTRVLLGSYPWVKNECPVAVSWLSFAYFLFLVFARRLIGRISQGKACAQQKNVDKKAILDVTRAEVAFFPHHGIFYSNLFAKDHFYSSKKSSPFFPSKIAHFEFDIDVDEKCLEYYKTHNISNFKWIDIPVNGFSIIRSFLSSVFIFSNALLVLSNIELACKFLKIYWKVECSKLRLTKMQRLKILLIGYDIQFPQSLAFACRIVGVKTIAAQERMISGYWMTPMIIDHYFTVGSETVKFMKSAFSSINTYYEVGPVRQKCHEEAVLSLDAKQLRDAYLNIVLVIDFHSVADWYENGRNIANNWNANSIFYDQVLQLSKDFPGACFLLKGKNYDFLKIPFFESYKQKFKTQKNILILEDMETWTPFTSVAVSDIGLARQSSLADEMLALGKPIIISDYGGFPSQTFDYGPLLTAYTDSELHEKFSNFFKNNTAYRNKLVKRRDQLFANPSVSNNNRVLDQITKIFNAVSRG